MEPKIVSPQAKPPSVTVIVACCGQLDYTRLCTLSLLRCSRQPFEIVFLDANSLDGTKEYLDGLADASAVRIEAITVSSGAEMLKNRREESIPVRGDYIALLNNDTIVTPGWLNRLVDAASEPGIGLAAPISNVGAAPFVVDPVPIFAKDWQDQHRGEFVELEQLAGGCVLLRREALQKLGAFPTRSALGTFEMERIGLKVREVGFRLRGCKEVFVHSFGSRRVRDLGQS